MPKSTNIVKLLFFVFFGPFFLLTASLKLRFSTEEATGTRLAFMRNCYLSCFFFLYIGKPSSLSRSALLNMQLRRKTRKRQAVKVVAAVAAAAPVQAQTKVKRKKRNPRIN